MSTDLKAAWAETWARRGATRALVEAGSGKTICFEELQVRALSWMRAQGPAARALEGRPVVFALPNGAAWLELFLGLVECGAVAVPLDTTEPPAALPRIAGELGGGFWWDGKTLHRTDGVRRFRDPEVALIKMTSGMTGRPRPLVFTGAELLADARQVTSTMGITAKDLNYALIPFGHSYGLGNLTLPLVAEGVPVVCGTAALPQAVAGDFAQWRPTVFPTVPAIWRALVLAGLPRDALDSLRLGISAGAPLPPEVARQFTTRFGGRLHAFYGSSETGGIAFDRDGRSTLEGGVGGAMKGVTIKLLRGGRVEVSSAAVTRYGHRRRSGGWGAWVMPDLVEVDHQGALKVRGRRGMIVKIAGRRVSLAEIERRLRMTPGVRDAWVSTDGTTEPTVGAAVVSDQTTEQLRSALLADTAAWKIPKRLLVMTALPMTDRGKVDSATLRQRLFGQA